MIRRLVDALAAIALGLAAFVILGYAICPSCMSLNPL